jgi:hypothetical protein
MHRSLRRRLGLGVAATALAGGLLFLGIPRVVGGLLSIPGDKVVNGIRYDRQTSASDVAMLAGSRQRSLRWLEDRRTWSDLGLAHLLAAGDPALGEEARRTRLEKAVAAIENGLALAPGDGYVWARLAIARYTLHGPTAAAADALTQSLLITEFDRRLVFDRLDLALAVWDHLAPDIRAMFLRQVAYGFDVSPKRLGELARSPERRVRLVAALADTPDRMEKFEGYLRRLGR